MVSTTGSNSITITKLFPLLLVHSFITLGIKIRLLIPYRVSVGTHRTPKLRIHRKSGT